MTIGTGERVWRLDLRGVNAYLARDGGDLVLVDAGAPRAAGRIRDGVAAAGFALGDVDRVLVTHYDLDHVGGLAGLAPDLDAPVYAAEPDASYLAGEARPAWRSWKGALQRASGLLLTRPDLPVRRVEDEERIGGLRAFHTPGHTPGHVVYVGEGLRTAFLGDLVRETDGALEPPPRFLNRDTSELRRSIRSFVRRTPPFSVACPGHGDPLSERGEQALDRLVR